MNTSNWVEKAQLVSALAALVALTFTAWQMRRGRLVADLQALQKFSEDANSREAALNNAGNDAAKDFAFNELLNHLELYTGAYNHGLFGNRYLGRDRTRFVRHRLQDTFIELEQNVIWHPKIESAIDRHSTFIEIRKFATQHRNEIIERKATRAAQIQMRAIT